MFIEGMCLILEPFKRVTSLLSGETYPTFVQTLPMLRSLKTMLMEANDDLISKDISCSRGQSLNTLSNTKTDHFDNMLCHVVRHY